MAKGNRNEALTLWKRQRENHERLEYTVLEVLANKAATPTEIMLARSMLVQARERITTSWELMQSAYADYHVKPLPPRFIEIKQTSKE